VIKATDLSAEGLAKNLEVPTAALLEEVHQRLYALVGAQPDKKARDKLFKGPALRILLIDDILAWNAVSPPPKQ
jgi:hypothetical protein